MRQLFSTVLLACLVLTAPRQAIPADNASWYIGAGAGISRLEPDTNSNDISVSDSHDVAFKVFAGYDWSERISTEAYYADLGEAEISPNGHVEYQNFGISGTYYFRDRPVDRQDWSLFGRLGLGRMRNDSDLRYKRNNDYHLLFGAGAEYGIARYLTLRLDLELFDEDAQLVSVNLLRRFGGGN